MLVCVLPFVYSPLCVRRQLFADTLCTSAPFARMGGQPLHLQYILTIQRLPQTALCLLRLVDAPRCVCTPLCMHRRVCAPPTIPPHIVHRGSRRSIDGSLCLTRETASPLPLNDETLVLTTCCLVCAPHCACTALCVHHQPFLYTLCTAPRFAGTTACFAQHVGPPPHPLHWTRFLRWQHTALCVHHLVYTTPWVCTANSS